MTLESLKAIIEDIGGPEKVLGIRNANGTKFIFSRYALSLDDFVTMGGVDFLKLRHLDGLNGEAVSYLIIDEIVHIYAVKDETKPIIIRDILN